MPSPVNLAESENLTSPARRSLGSAHAARNLALLVFLLNFIFMPSRFASGDPWAWRAEACSIVNSGSLAVDSQTVKRLGGQAGQYFDWNSRTNAWYSKFGFMNTLLSIPPVYVESALSGAANPLKVSILLVYNIYNILISVLTALVLFAVASRYTSRNWLRWVYVLACLYTTYLWFYQRLQSAEIYQVFFFATAYWLTVRYMAAFRGGRSRWPLLSGAWVCIAALIFIRIVYVLLIPALCLAVGYELYVRSSGSKTACRREFLRTLPLLLLPPLIICALLAWVNDAKFGSPFFSGYHQWHTDQTRFTSDWQDGVYGFLFSTRWSIFIYFPLLIFAIPGLRRFAREYPSDAIFAFSAFVLSLFIIGSLPTWRGEWTYGPRYLIFILPVLSLPALLFFDGLIAAPMPQWKKFASTFFVAVVLSYSLRQQWEVNRWDFWTVHHLSLPFQDTRMSSQLFRYFNDHTEGTILADLHEHRGDLNQSQLMQQLNGMFDPHFVDQYKLLIEDLMKKTNFYWWSQPDAGHPARI